VRGESFELGELLSAAVSDHLTAAWPALVELCQAARPSRD
jgi:hypothetical protein